MHNPHNPHNPHKVAIIRSLAEQRSVRQSPLSNVHSPFLRACSSALSKVTLVLLCSMRATLDATHLLERSIVGSDLASTHTKNPRGPAGPSSVR